MTIQKIALAPIKDKQRSESSAYVLEEALVAPITHLEEAFVAPETYIEQKPFRLDDGQSSHESVLPTPKQLRRDALAADVAYVQKERDLAGVDPLQDEGFTTDVLQMRKEAFAALATHVHRAIPLQTVALSQQQTVPLTQKKKKKGLLTTVIRFAVTILLFAILFKNLDIAKLGAAFLHIDPSIALIGLVIGIYTLVVSAYQWQSLLNAEKIPLDLAKLINLYMVGIAFNHFLPTSMGGDAVKIYYVGREANNMPGSASAAVMSRITGFFGMLLVAYPALLIFHKQFDQKVVSLLILLSLVVLSMVIGTFVFASLFSRFAQAKKIQVALESILPAFIRKKLNLGGILEKAIDIGNTLIMSAKKPRSMIIATLFGVMFHIVACLNYYSYGLALHINVPFQFYLIAIPLVSLIGFLPISIGGFGLREGSLIIVFSTVHVLAANTLTLAFIMDVQMLFFAAIGGFMYLFMSNLISAQKKSALT
ncbi:MAG: hypothetical protein PVS3B1_03780 [Ktedonobacteraceae bacterium]